MNALGSRLGLRDSTGPIPIADDDGTGDAEPHERMGPGDDRERFARIPELRSIVRDPEETINGPQLGRNVENDNDARAALPGRDRAPPGRERARPAAVLVGSAERDGRELVIVVLGTDGDPVSFAVEKLDAEFAAGDAAGRESRRRRRRRSLRPARFATAQARLEALVNLPAVLGRPALASGAIGSQAPPTPSSTPPPTTLPTEPEDGDGGGGLLTITNVLIFLLLAGLLTVVVLRRRTIMKRQRRRQVRQRTLTRGEAARLDRLRRPRPGGRVEPREDPPTGGPRRAEPLAR